MSARTEAGRRAAAELAKLRRAYPALADSPEAQPLMRRLASMRMRFAELNEAIEEAGGAAKADAGQVGEWRQIYRQCLLSEKELRSWSQFHPAEKPDAMREFAIIRKQLIERGRAAQAQRKAAIEGEIAAPEPVTVRQLLERDDTDDNE